jgi:hypothetical protein
MISLRGRRLAIAGLVLTTVAVGPREARADAAAADALFADARRLMEEKRYLEACSKFEGSYKEEPTLGTLLNLANCNEVAGQLATAWARWGEAEAKARQQGDDRAELAHDRREALAPRLPKLLVLVINPRPGLSVLRDDVELASGSFGSALPVDPGLHAVQVVREDGVLHRQDVQLVEGQQVRVELDLAQIEAAAPKVPPKRQPVRVVTMTPEDYDPGAGQRTAGWVTAGFGTAAVIGGFVLGGLALAAKGDTECVDSSLNGTKPKVCDLEGFDSIENAEGLAAAGQWIGIGGAVLAGVGITLVLTAPDGGASELERRASLPPRLALDLGGHDHGARARLRGSF